MTQEQKTLISNTHRTKKKKKKKEHLGIINMMADMKNPVKYWDYKLRTSSRN